MNKSVVRLIIIALTFICVAAELSIHSEHSRSKQSHPVSATVQPLMSEDYETTIVHGEVLGRDDRTIIVRTEDAIRNITINDYADITRNTFDSTIHSIRANDVVAIYMTGTTIRAVNAVTGTLFAGFKTAILSTFILIVLLSVISTLMKRVPKHTMRPSFAPTT